jgi:ribosome-associated toxin RatA of RatAB toxin-antitoxin module
MQKSKVYLSKKIIISHFVGVLIIIGQVSFAQKTADWNLKKYSDGIAIYTRTAENSAYKELKSVVQLKTSLSSIIAVLNDCESYPQWVFHCEKSSTLKKISETELIHYQTVTAPWPVDDRDFVVDLKIVQDDKTGIVYQTATCIPNYIPVALNHVRITELNAIWTLTPMKNGFVNVEYQLLVNPGGNIPAWLANLTIIDGPFETMLNLKDWVMKEKYQKTQIPFIKELE